MVTVMWHGGWDGADWFLMTFMMVAFWGGLVALVVWLVQSPRRQEPPPRSAKPAGMAEELLAERFARGEIDSEEFSRRRAMLRADR